jgi:GH25 family lysozyme M1 (1,4-beta-N-acetylmuramidase)/LysM repeat protein
MPNPENQDLVLFIKHYFNLEKGSVTMQSRNPGNWKVLDMSHFQGDPDFAAIKADPQGIVGVILKATEGTTYVDAKFQSFYDQATKAGLWVGAYHFGRYGTDAALARREADHFKSTIAGKNLKLIALDIEVGDGDLTDSSLAFIDQVKGLGIYTVLYTGASFANAHFHPGPIGEVPLWVAHYGVDTPKANPTWSNWRLFQFTSSARVQGIAGNVDMSEMIPDGSPVPQPQPAPPTPQPTPVPQPSGSAQGTVVVVADTLNVRTGPDTSYPVVKKIHHNESYQFYGTQNGWYNLGGAQWASGGGGKYLQEQHAPAPQPAPSGQMYTVVKGDTLSEIAVRFHTTVSQLKAWNGLTSDLIRIDQKLKVSGGAPAPQPAPAPSGNIPVVGTIQIVGVSKACFICDRPSQNSNNLGTAALGSRLPISGSVPGWWEVVYNGRRAYVNEKYGRRV